jgi:predicted MFS family arabinose efflux permease
LTADRAPARLPALTLVLLGSLYFSQGLPSGFLAHGLPALMRSFQVPIEWIGMVKLLALPWVLKVLWAPFVDQLGSRRRWILSMQMSVCIVLMGMSFTSPAQLFGSWLLPVLCLLFFLNSCSATQDVATDGLAVRLLPPRFRGLGNSLQVGGYKLGMIVGGSLLLISIDRWGWQASFAGMALLILMMTLPTCLSAEAARPASTGHSSTGNRKGPASYAGFFRQKNIGVWLAVLLSYKLADSLGSTLISPLLVDQGFSLTELGTLRLCATLTGLLGALAGGLLYSRLGPGVSLMVFGMLQALGIGSFALLAQDHPSMPLVWGIALFEQAADGMSTVALFALMMGWCRQHSEGGDYSLQAALQVVTSGLAGMASGFVASALGYRAFFLLAGILGLMVLIPVWRYLRQHQVGTVFAYASENRCLSDGVSNDQRTHGCRGQRHGGPPLP